MPIYEFYCADCHMLFSFLARRPGTRKRPSCPRCERPRLERRASSFAISSGRAEPAPDDELPEGVDESRLERVMSEMVHEMDHVDEDNPRQMARFMRKLFDGAGLDLGPGMEEAMRRMEAGEDPDQIEEELGDALESDEPWARGAGKLRALRRRLPPRVDPTLYEL